MFMTTLFLCLLLLAFIAFKCIDQVQQVEARVVVHTDQRRRVCRRE